MEIIRERTCGARDCRGFSMLQVIIVLAVVSVLATTVVLGVRSTRASMRLNAAARTLAQNIEKARLDAIRRHDTATVAFSDATNYEISMDFANTGNRQTRQFTLDSGITASADANGNYPSVGFDWRGRTSQCSTSFQFQNDRGESASVQVGGSGDVTVNNAINSLPNINYATVNENSNVVSSAIVNGSVTKLSLDPCNSGGGTSVPPATVTCAAGQITMGNGLISIRKNGLSSGSTIATVNAAGTITVSPDPNLSVTPASKTFSSSSGGTQTFTITSVTKAKGTYPVNFYFTCSSPAVLYVQVTN
ncbi:MAG TPA: GspH/FimT family pseudopilin [Pyrinomonadaceae bacterium]|nr:GspH/FimT family pseudopilin [Pyrinomonadaceae bacterium]